MAIITATTYFTLEAGAVETTFADIEFAPSSVAGGSQYRKLEPPPVIVSFPNLPPLIYECNPDKWTNFDLSPLKRPFTRHQTTIGGAITQEWPGFDKDVIIEEVWDGGGDRMSMPLSMFRFLYQYYVNRPDYGAEGYIRWSPRDLTTKRYNIVVLDLLVGAQRGIQMDLTVFHGYIHDAVTFRFAIISEVV